MASSWIAFHHYQNSRKYTILRLPACLAVSKTGTPKIASFGSKRGGGLRSVICGFPSRRFYWLLRSRWFGQSWFRSYLRSEEHTSELQSRGHLVCRLLL